MKHIPLILAVAAVVAAIVYGPAAIGWTWDHAVVPVARVIADVEAPEAAPVAVTAPANGGNRVEAPVAPETVEVASNPTDLCEGLINPVWAAVVARNDGMLQANYSAWVRDVMSRDGSVFDAATCVPAATLAHPGDTIDRAGIWQLITVPVNGPDTWANRGTFKYAVAEGCRAEGFGAQGDNPAALFVTADQAVMEVFNSTGTSLLVQVTCR